MKKIFLVLFGALFITACADSNMGNKQIGGGLIGAGLGGLAGSQIGSGSGKLVATGAGVLLGALLGSEVGKSLDKADQMYAKQNATNTLENNKTGQSGSWRNPDNGNSGTITPTKTYQNNSGQYCREYQQTVTVGGKTENAYGTACRQPDGSWKVVS